MYRVFLVDDEEITLMQTAETVPWMDNGFVVAGTESDPVRAVERIIEEKPEVVFSDLKMPRMDGHELMRRVREQGVTPEFVMLSAYGNFEDARRFFRQEGFDYLLKPMRMAEVEFLLERLTRRLSAKYPADAAAFDGVGDPAGEFADGTVQNPSEKFTALVDYVKENFRKHFTLDQLGKQFGLSGSYICTLFAKYFNTSLTSFVTSMRMAEAAERLRNSEELLKSIAVFCGYKDYYYFSKVFKDYYGVSPAEYRKAHGGGEESQEAPDVEEAVDGAGEEH